MRDLRAKGKKAGRGVRSEVMIDIGVVRVHDARLVDGAEWSFDTRYHTSGRWPGRALRDTRSGITVLLVGALDSPGGGLREMRQRGAVAAGLLNPVLCHGSRA